MKPNCSPAVRNISRPLAHHVMRSICIPPGASPPSSDTSICFPLPGPFFANGLGVKPCHVHVTWGGRGRGRGQRVVVDGPGSPDGPIDPEYRAVGRSFL